MFEHYRAQFPACERYLYLNHAGVAPTSRRVQAAAASWFEDLVEHGIAHEAQWESHTEAVRAATAASKVSGSLALPGMK